MSREADKVAGVLAGVEALEKKAEDVCNHVDGAFRELDDAFGMARAYGDGCYKAAARIKGFLSRISNSPPTVGDDGKPLIEHKKV